MPYVISYAVELENGVQEVRELVYFPKPDNGDITHEQAQELGEESKEDYFFDCLSVTYVSHYCIPDPKAG